MRYRIRRLRQSPSQLPPLPDIDDLELQSRRGSTNTETSFVSGISTSHVAHNLRLDPSQLVHHRPPNAVPSRRLATIPSEEEFSSSSDSLPPPPSLAPPPPPRDVPKNTAVVYKLPYGSSNPSLPTDYWEDRLDQFRLSDTPPLDNLELFELYQISMGISLSDQQTSPSTRSL